MRHVGNYFFTIEIIDDNFNPQKSSYNFYLNVIDTTKQDLDLDKLKIKNEIDNSNPI